MEMRRLALEDEQRRREQLERRLRDEAARRHKLVEKEVKMREKQFAQVCLWGRELATEHVPSWPPEGRLGQDSGLHSMWGCLHLPDWGE